MPVYPVPGQPPTNMVYNVTSGYQQQVQWQPPRGQSPGHSPQGGQLTQRGASPQNHANQVSDPAVPSITQSQSYQPMNHPHPHQGHQQHQRHQGHQGLPDRMGPPVRQHSAPDQTTGPMNQNATRPAVMNQSTTTLTPDMLNTGAYQPVMEEGMAEGVASELSIPSMRQFSQSHHIMKVGHNGNRHRYAPGPNTNAAIAEDDRVNTSFNTSNLSMCNASPSNGSGSDNSTAFMGCNTMPELPALPNLDYANTVRIPRPPSQDVPRMNFSHSESGAMQSSLAPDFIASIEAPDLLPMDIELSPVPCLPGMGQTAPVLPALGMGKTAPVPGAKDPKLLKVQQIPKKLPSPPLCLEKAKEVPDDQLLDGFEMLGYDDDEEVADADEEEDGSLSPAYGEQEEEKDESTHDVEDRPQMAKK